MLPHPLHAAQPLAVQAVPRLLAVHMLVVQAGEAGLIVGVRQDAPPVRNRVAAVLCAAEQLLQHPGLHR